MKHKNKNCGFTMVELLTTIVIIAILLGLLIPALNMVRNSAWQARQKAQFTSIDMSIMAFKNDYGDYPPSYLNSNFDYAGAQKLSEALVGWDLMGFHPDIPASTPRYAFIAEGGWADGGVYDSQDPVNLDNRKGPYMDTTTVNVFKLNDLFEPASFTGTQLDRERFVICDSFGRKRVKVGDVYVKAGRPILYYKADPSKKQFTGTGTLPGLPSPDIYNCYDNFVITMVANREDSGNIITHPLATPGIDNYFYDTRYKIVDQKVTMARGGIRWPHRPDSYIMISAGADGRYGTSDDITNFGR